MYRMQRIVPLIGPTVAGPLGVKHLPRMWLKSVLSAAGLLWEGYFDNYRGFNQRVVDGLGLEPEPWFAFLATMPTYPQAEDYVRAHATSLNPASIAAINEHALHYLRPEEAAAVVRARVGIDDPDFRISSRLIDVDDWDIIHRELVAHRDDEIEPLVPMVSSAEISLSGIPHLPRLWMKASLRAVRALPSEWKSGIECGFDKRVSETIGLDLTAASAYINRELPSFLAFERWVLERIPPADDATKAKWVAQNEAMQKSEEQAAAECIEAGAPGAGLRGTVLLNDLVDWRYMHDHAVANRVARA